MKMKYLLFTLLLPAFLWLEAQPQGQDLSKLIDSLKTVYLADSTHHGLGFGIKTPDQDYTYYFGGKYSAREEDTGASTLFEIGSISKLFTAHILAKLEEDNQISRFDLLAKYLKKRSFVGSEKITLANLATHTSGLPAFDNTASLTELEGYDENDPYGLFTYDLMLDLLEETDSISSYGKVKYSNFGIGVLTYAMELAAGESFDNLFARYIKEQMGLPNTHLILPERFITNMAIPHRNGEVMPLINLADMRPAGGIKTTVPDMVKFMDYYLNPADEDLPLVESVLTNQLNGEEQIGLGWGIFKRNNVILNFHTGGTYGSSGILIIAPQLRTGLIILANDQTDQLIQFAFSIMDFLHSSS